MKRDEQLFLQRIYEIRTPEYTVRDIINEPDFPIHYKRAWYILNKWIRNGWYDCGVTLDLGWLTMEGKRVAESGE